MAHSFYLGSYTRTPGSAGISRWELSYDTGALAQTATLPQVEHPSYLAFSADGNALYAALETKSMLGTPGGGVACFVLNDGAAACLSIQNTEGALPCHLAVIPEKHKLYVANYGGGSVSVFDIGEDYGLSPCLQVAQHLGGSHDPLRQEAPHAHQALPLSPDSLLVLDLGLDEGLIYDVGPDGMLGKISQRLVLPAGSGPRHAVLYPGGDVLFLTCVLSNLVISYRRTPGGWQQVQVLPVLPTGHDCAESFTSAIRLHGSGEYLAIANRGHDSITLLRISPDGEMTWLSTTPCGAAWPRDCNWLGDFLVCACEHGNRLTTLWLDVRTGHLTPVGDGAETMAPSCVLPMPKEGAPHA